MKIAVGIATSGRRAILREALRELSRQTWLPDTVFVCPASESDYDATAAANLPYPIVVIKGSRGLTAQRNAILDAAQGFDIMVFFDDDFFPMPTYLAEVERCFASNPEVVAMSGHVIADGAHPRERCSWWQYLLSMLSGRPQDQSDDLASVR